MRIILMSGGVGKRLWPLSERDHPKQFLKIFRNANGPYSMVQRVYRQLKDAKLDLYSLICAGQEQREFIREQIGDVPVAWEPAPRDTFPAIALSCAYLSSECGVPDDEAVVVVPIDSYADQAYFETLKKLPALLEKSRAEVVLMGKEPTGPDTQYGYILPKSEKNGIVRVAGFHEKPPVEKARELVREGALWNIGVFCFQLSLMRKWLKAYDLQLNYRQLYRQFGKLPKISFDYQVLEKSLHIAALRFGGTWRDLGNWCELSEVLPLHSGRTIQADCEGTFVLNTLHIPVVVLGAKDTIVVATEQGILITDCEHAPSIKNIDMSRKSGCYRSVKDDMKACACEPRRADAGKEEKAL